MEKQRFYLQQTEPLFEVNRTSIRNGQSSVFALTDFLPDKEEPVFLIFTGFILPQTAFLVPLFAGSFPRKTFLSAKLGGFSSL
ncbi:hypothetical protein JCM10003_2997 [Bacteroides pyogenes JCM 10003]|nr:hypothetical protein JCM10003_2997 [Bacteroides pyogenes JCM 10003]